MSVASWPLATGVTHSTMANSVRCDGNTACHHRGKGRRCKEPGGSLGSRPVLSNATCGADVVGGDRRQQLGRDPPDATQTRRQQLRRALVQVDVVARGVERAEAERLGDHARDRLRFEFADGVREPADERVAVQQFVGHLVEDGGQRLGGGQVVADLDAAAVARPKRTAAPR